MEQALKASKAVTYIVKFIDINIKNTNNCIPLKESKGMCKYYNSKIPISLEGNNIVKQESLFAFYV